ncbi:hypothetical protein POVCU2_0019730 [Plasmodium ovale curtisi]|nr:hypothetical protein POVCU2_0019730 [Plasmodium ovale curtisi]
MRCAEKVQKGIKRINAGIPKKKVEYLRKSSIVRAQYKVELFRGKKSSSSQHTSSSPLFPLKARKPIMCEKNISQEGTYYEHISNAVAATNNLCSLTEKFITPIKQTMVGSFT